MEPDNVEDSEGTPQATRTRLEKENDDKTAASGEPFFDMENCYMAKSRRKILRRKFCMASYVKATDLNRSEVTIWPILFYWCGVSRMTD